MKRALITIVLVIATAATAFGADTAAPTVTAFAVPSLVNTLKVPVTSLAAADNVAVTGYLITSTATPPPANSGSWSGSKPASYTVSSQGIKTLYAWAKDRAGNVSKPAMATVTIDMTAPVITGFAVPPVTNSVKIPVAAFAASDNNTVAGYMITAGSAVPSANSGGWSSSAPATFTATGAGVKTLYAWAKDRAGNISKPATATVNIDMTAPIVTDFSVPAAVNTPAVPINTFAASDNTAVAAYLVTLTANTPAAGAPWSAIKPASVAVNTAGLTTLYAWAKDRAGNISLARTATCNVNIPRFTMAQTISDGAQRTTIAFSGLAMMTGNLEAQTFFPPGKVADYTGFQYLRDNDPDDMGHNTSFLTRIANNVIYILNDTQFGQLKTLAVAQQAQIDEYGYKRYPLMKAFRRLLDGDIPAGSAGLNLNSVKKASHELYLIDGQISFDRALLYAALIKSLSSDQKTYLDAMKGKGFNSWPDIAKTEIDARMQSLPQGTAVAVMTYASDLFSWYAGSLEADVYFCPERHGTYYGGFYIKDAPAIGHEGYSIDEQLTATAGAALSDSSRGYVTPEQAAVMSSLVATQRDNLYASATANIVQLRTDIAKLLRSLLTSAGPTDPVKAKVLELSGIYGELDGANNYYYATVFDQVYGTLTADQVNRLDALRRSIMSGTYSDGTPFDYSIATTYFLYSQVINENMLAPYIDDTDYLFFEP